VGFNGQVTVSGSNNWVLTVTFHAPQKVIGSWNYTGTWDSTGYVLTARPNGSGNVIGFTVQHGGNLTAPTVTCSSP
jgi:endo-1,4-beta-xylanase